MAKGGGAHAKFNAGETEITMLGDGQGIGEVSEVRATIEAWENCARPKT